MDLSEHQHIKIVRSPVVSIIEQHVEEAAFCWLRREDALWRPSLNLNQFYRFDQRLDAHLEGLRLAVDSAWPYALKRMNQWKTADEVFAASYIAIQAGDEDQLNTIATVVQANSNAMAGVSAALQWMLLQSGKEKALLAIQFFWQQQDALKNAVIDTALQIPEVNINAILTTAIQSTDIAVRAKAFEAIGNYHLTEYKPVLHNALGDSEPLCRLAASTSLAIMGEPEHQRETMKLLPSLKGNNHLKNLLVWCSTCTENDFENWLKIAEENLSLRDLIWANAFRGNSNALTRLTSLLDHKVAAPLAAYAIQHITGIDLDTLSESEMRQSNLQDDDEKNMSPVIKQLHRESEGLSSASPDAIKKWLSMHWGLFDNGDRFLYGTSINESSLTINTTCSMPQHWHQSLIKTLNSHSLDWATFPKPFFIR